MRVELRGDLAFDCYSIPAYDAIEEHDKGMGLTMLNAIDLEGAVVLDDNTDERNPSYNFEHIKLKDGRAFYVHGIDLDYVGDDDV